jgi:hypothetical protein
MVSTVSRDFCGTAAPWIAVLKRVRSASHAIAVPSVPPSVSRFRTCTCGIIPSNGVPEYKSRRSNMCAAPKGAVFPWVGRVANIPGVETAAQ